MTIKYRQIYLIVRSFLIGMTKKLDFLIFKDNIFAVDQLYILSDSALTVDSNDLNSLSAYNRLISSANK